jgi:menaquinone-dependent protoporphyrinogen IX oxidase
LIKVFVVYDTKYGNTKLAAEKVVEGLKEVEGIEADIGYAKEVDPATLADYDAIVIGAPNHMARPSRTMTKFVDELAKIDLKAKDAAVFDTYAGKERMDRAIKKLEKIVETKLPGINLISPGLSVRVHGVTGPVVDGELSRCVDFGKKIAGNLKVNKPNM